MQVEVRERSRDVKCFTAWSFTHNNSHIKLCLHRGLPPRLLARLPTGCLVSTDRGTRVVLVRLAERANAREREREITQPRCADSAPR